jgi:hypothetical protein
MLSSPHSHFLDNVYCKWNKPLFVPWELRQKSVKFQSILQLFWFSLDERWNMEKLHLKAWIKRDNWCSESLWKRSDSFIGLFKCCSLDLRSVGFISSVSTKSSITNVLTKVLWF